MKRLLLLLLGCLCLGGCASLPGEERSFALCLGVHTSTSGVEVAVQLPNYKGDQKYLVLSAAGDSFDEALSSLTAVSPSRLHFGQLRLVVFSQETAASAGFPQLVAEISNIPSMRLSAMALLTEDSVSQLLETLTPQTGVRLSKYLDTLLRTRVELGYLPGSTLSDMRRMGQRQSPALGRMALKKEGLPQDGLNAPAEALSAGSEGEVIFGGCGLIGQDGLLHDTLSLRETQLLTLLLGRSRDLPLTWEEAAFTLHVKELSVNWTKGQVTAKVVGRALMTRGAPAQAEALLEEDLRAVLQRLNAASCDALGLRRQEMFTHPLSMGMSVEAWTEEMHRLQVEAEVTLLPRRHKRAPRQGAANKGRHPPGCFLQGREILRLGCRLRSCSCARPHKSPGHRCRQAEASTVPQPRLLHVRGHQDGHRGRRHQPQDSAVGCSPSQRPAAPQ